MDGAGANMCKAVNIEGVAVKATFVSRVCVGGNKIFEDNFGILTIKLSRFFKGFY